MILSRFPENLPSLFPGKPHATRLLSDKILKLALTPAHRDRSTFVQLVGRTMPLENGSERPELQLTDTPGGKPPSERWPPGGSLPLLIALAPTPSVPTGTWRSRETSQMALGIPASCIGMIVSGDVDGVTIYTDRHARKVVFPKAPPKEPPTDLQIFSRNRFKSAQAEFMSISPTQKAAYERLTQRASLCLTGQNLFIHVAMMHTFATLTTLQVQTGISVNPPTPV